MKTQHTDTFALDNFEGPLDFLLYLIRKSEIDIYDVSIQSITEQFLAKLKDLAAPSVDAGAEFVGVTATLLWLKSKMLLPKTDNDDDLDEEEDPCFEIIHKLVEYCRFKDIAQTMKIREEEQCSYFPRGARAPTGTIIQPSLGIEHLTLEDLEKLFSKALDKASNKKSTINEEEWRVSDKISSIRSALADSPRVKMENLFSPDLAQLELIVTFLAVLELMKLGEIQVVWNDEKTHALMLRGTENV